MQLSGSSRAAAAVTVLGLFAAEPLAVADEPSPPTAPPPQSAYVTRASSEVAAYADTDHVFVITPTMAATVSNPTAGWDVSGRYLVDVVSAASVDIVSTASPRWIEVRHAGTLAGSYKPGTVGVSVSSALSVEPDYTSVTGGLVVSKDLLEKNLTLIVGYDHGHDISGRHGTAYSVFSRQIDRNGVKAGGSLVLDAATIATALIDASFESGDASKPYRYVPLFAPGTVVARGASVASVNALRLPARVLEQLPTFRARYALTGRIAHRFQASTLRLDERVYADSWGLGATSTDLRYLVDLSRRVEVGPHARVHGQTPVDFWQRAYELRPGADYPALRTGDRELGPLVSFTGGGTFRWGIGPREVPKQWVLGVDLNVSITNYINDLYIRTRGAAIGGVSLEGEL